MATGKKAGKAARPSVKRVVTELAPGVRTLLDAYLKDYNEGPDRVSSPLNSTDVINQALDRFLPARPGPGERPQSAQEQS